YGQDRGTTTVFIGANSDDISATPNSTPANPRGFIYSKFVAGFTPSSSSDYSAGYHTINSDSYDVAFVDPVLSTSTAKTRSALLPLEKTERNPGDPTAAYIFDIRRGIAHEAGNTFDLVHVRSDNLPDVDPKTDKIGSGSIPDAMAHDVGNNN